MTEKLKPCPKCNSNAIDFMRDRSGMWHVECFNCGFMHIACLSMRQAVEMWNASKRKKSSNDVL